MSNRRARIADSDPLTATDKVLEKIEQANQSNSQPDKKQTSSKVNNSTSQKPKKSTSQPVNSTASSDNPTTEEVNNSTSQQVNLSNSTSQEAKKSEIKEVDLLTSQPHEVLSLTSEDGVDGGQSQDLGSQEVNVSESQEVINIGSQEVNQLTIQPVNQQPLRKATFQIDGGVLDALDRYHLQLLLDLGKRNAPYKETIVSEAIAQWLERAAKSPDRAVKSLLKRQEQR